MKKRPTGKFAWSVKVGEKGQIVIPKEARDLFDISPGDTLILLGDVKRGIAIPPKSALDVFSAMYLSALENGQEEDDE